MKLRLVKFRRPQMKSLVLTNPKGGVVMWKEIGQEIEIKDHQFAFKILSECGDMIELVEEKAVKEKAVKAPRNKAMTAQETK